MLMMGLLAVAVVAAIGFFMRKRSAAQQSNPAAPAGMQYARVNAGHARDTANQSTAHSTPAYKVAMPATGTSASGASIGTGIDSAIGSGIGAAVGGTSHPAVRIPADFDVEGFERNAKVNFVRLQAANDAGDLNDIRQFTTPEMFAEIKLEMADRGTAVQKTDVVSVQVEVIEVDEDADRYLVSVRFKGVIRDDVTALDEAFDEVWHLMKSRQGNSGWVLSGIQQTLNP